MQQEPCLFNNTIYANVEFGLIGTEWEDASPETKKDLVKQACFEAFADEFINRLPDVSHENVVIGQVSSRHTLTAN